MVILFFMFGIIMGVLLNADLDNVFKVDEEVWMHRETIEEKIDEVEEKYWRLYHAGKMNWERHSHCEMAICDIKESLGIHVEDELFNH